VGGEVGRRATSRTRSLGCLQGGFYDAGDARGDPVLKLEDLFQRAVEMIGPEMRPATGIDQLSGDAHPIAAFAHRAFEHIARPQLPADPPHIYRLPLV